MDSWNPPPRSARRWRSARATGTSRDELYFLAAGRHLTVGYVDQPALRRCWPRLTCCHRGTPWWPAGGARARSGAPARCPARHARSLTGCSWSADVKPRRPRRRRRLVRRARPQLCPLGVSKCARRGRPVAPADRHLRVERGAGFGCAYCRQPDDRLDRARPAVACLARTYGLRAVAGSRVRWSGRGRGSGRTSGAGQASPGRAAAAAARPQPTVGGRGAQRDGAEPGRVQR